MKNFLILAVLVILINIGSVGVVHAQLVDCQITASKVSGCEAYAGKKFLCQIYDGFYKNGTAKQCASSCSEASGIPERCARVIVQRASGHLSPEEKYGAPTNTEVLTPTTAQPKKEDGQQPIKVQNYVPSGDIQNIITKLENINTDDGVSDSEAQYAINLIMSFIQNMFTTEVSSKVAGIANIVGGVKDSFISKIPFIGDNDGDAEQELEDDDIYTTDEDFETDLYGGSDFNTFGTREWADGVEIARMIDPYGKERFTSDGKHYYDNEYDAAHSQEGFSNVTNVAGDTFSDLTQFLFKGKSKDADEELQNSIAGEVLSDSKSQSEKDVEKAHEKISAKIKTPAGGDIPAKVIIMVAEESKEKDFAQGVRRYISERKKGNDMSYIRQNFSQELSGGYGTFGKGVSQSTVARQAEGVLYARYEESYQRYLLAKRFGRTE